MKAKQNKFQEIILDSIADGVFTVDTNWKITSFNKAAEKIIGIPKEQALGKTCKDVFLADVCDKNCVLRSTMKTGKSCSNKTIHILNRKGVKIPISISTAMLKNERGKIVGGVETFRDMSSLEKLRKEVLGKHTFSDIITKDYRMLKIFNVLPGVSKSNSTILITGESGTGKELMARAVHSLSGRAAKPFISVNCGALPDTLLESELFGYKKGAFTDAKQDKPGRIKLAEKGTLFLDEIGDTSKAMQVKILRFLQEKTYEPLGAVKSETADVRIITATNQDLHHLIEEKKFRKDLFYRINVLNITLPPLRERKGDIPLLVESFLSRANSIYGKEISRLKEDALTLIMKHDFPGNIRELQNIIEHAAIMCTSNNIRPVHLPEYLLEISTNSVSGHQPIESLQDFERKKILEVLEKNRFNKKNTAKALNIHTSTLWRKIKKLAIDI